MLIAGPLADRVFEPAMTGDTAMAELFGPLVGTGVGTGMALIYVFAGVLGAVGALSGYLIPAIRNVEDIMPDHDTLPEAAPEQPEITQSETTQAAD